MDAKPISWRTFCFVAERLTAACVLPPVYLIGWPDRDDLIPEILLPFLAAKVLTSREVPLHVLAIAKKHPLPAGLSWDDPPECIIKAASSPSPS